MKALDEFTDYRTYMDYDIKIIHSDGNYFFYSKVCEEKSGGETQTPFYVTVAASFVQLYKNNISGEAIGLVMFDEAFNNMDAGGFEIYRDLCVKTKIPFQRYRMDLDTLVSHQRYGKELTENDRERLKKILEANSIKLQKQDFGGAKSNE